MYFFALFEIGLFNPDYSLESYNAARNPHPQPFSRREKVVRSNSNCEQTYVLDFVNNNSF